MGDGSFLIQVLPVLDGDAEELNELTGRLRAELLALDVQSVDPLTRESAPEGAKGLSAVAGWLAVHLGAEALRTVLGTVADWASRNGRTVEVSSNGGVLKLGRATREQQERIIDAWLAQHPPIP